MNDHTKKKYGVEGENYETWKRNEEYILEREKVLEKLNTLEGLWIDKELCSIFRKRTEEILAKEEDTGLCRVIDEHLSNLIEKLRNLLEDFSTKRKALLQKVAEERRTFYQDGLRGKEL